MASGRAQPLNSSRQGAQDLHAALTVVDEQRQVLIEQATLIAKLQALHERQSGMLEAAAQLVRLLVEDADPGKRGRGRRPKNRDALIRAFPRMRQEFIGDRPDSRPTDEAVLVWWWAREFERLGLGSHRVANSAFKSKLKTMRNALSKARAASSPEIPK